MAEEERAKAEREVQKQQQINAVREHLRDCKQCIVEFYGGSEFLELQYSGPNFSGQACVSGYNLIRPLVGNGIGWRGHALKAPKAAA